MDQVSKAGKYAGWERGMASTKATVFTQGCSAKGVKPDCSTYLLVYLPLSWK